MTDQLNDILTAYALSDPEPSRATLADWIARYPQFADELTAFTADWQLLVWTADASLLPGGDRLAPVDAAAENLILRGVSAAQEVFFQKWGTQPSGSTAEMRDRPIRTFMQAAEAAGLSMEGLAAQTVFSESLLRKLDRRLIAFASMPREVVQRLADALGKSIVAIEQYLQLQPTFAPGARHLAKQVPTLPKRQVDFHDAVRNDRALTEPQRQALLSLPRPPAPGDDPSSMK